MFCTVMKFLYCNENLPVLDDPGRVRNQITSIACQIQQFDFDCNLVVTRKLIIRIPPPLGSKPGYECYQPYRRTSTRFNANTSTAVHDFLFADDGTRVSQRIGGCIRIWWPKTSMAELIMNIYLEN